MARAAALQHPAGKPAIVSSCCNLFKVVIVFFCYMHLTSLSEPKLADVHSSVIGPG